MRRPGPVLLAVAAGLLAGLVTAAPAQAAGSVQFTQIYYDSPGTDRGSNASLNAEWVMIKNGTGKPVNLKSWTVTDAANHVYTFGAYSLAAGKTIKIHTGKGTDTATDRYQQRAAYVWNNDKDTATLRNASKKAVDACSYTDTPKTASSATC